MKVGPFMALLLLVLMASACAGSDPAGQRARRAAKGRGDILIGAGGPWSSRDGAEAWRGMEMALEEINSAGGIGGRKLRIIPGDDESSVDTGARVAQGFADDMDMIAVIGHLDSYVSVPNSIVYEYHGMLMLSPYSTAPKLTRQGFRRVFRTVPDDTVFGSRLARFADSRGLRRVMIYHAQDLYGTGLANAFERECEELGIAVPDRLAYDSLSDARVFRKDLIYWRESFSFDAIFLAGTAPQAPAFIREARGAGIMVPILGGDGLDTPELARLAGEAAEGTFVGSTFVLDDPAPEAAEFAAAFTRRYGAKPDASAAQGYDTVKVLAQAMREAGSAVPDKVAEALRSMPGWEGVAGTYRFDAKGDLMGRDILIKVLREGEFLLFRE